jgi:ketosteroid isomerase-like protein
MTTTRHILESYLAALQRRDLDAAVALFADQVDWDIPGDVGRAGWLGRRRTRPEIAAFFRQLWGETQPVSARVDDIMIDGDRAIVAGEFATRMRRTDRVVQSLFFLQVTVKDGAITRYRLLEDSHAVSVALAGDPPRG